MQNSKNIKKHTDAFTYSCTKYFRRKIFTFYTTTKCIYLVILYNQDNSYDIFDSLRVPIKFTTKGLFYNTLWPALI